MEKIEIRIPDNLSPLEEVFLIHEQLGKKMLPGKNKLLGSGYEIKQLETQIVIIREPIDKPIITRECPVCKTIFDHSLSKILYTNYGGNIKQHRFCSEECRNVVMDLAGDGRAAIRKALLKPIQSF